VAISDLNGDGVPDLAVATFIDGSVQVLLGKGDGTFGDPQAYATNQALESIAVADVNQDGTSDLVVGTFSTNQVGVLLGNGNGTFGTAQFFDAGNNTASLTVGQLKGDNFPDVAVAGTFTGTVGVLLNDGQWSGPGTANCGTAIGHESEAAQTGITQAEHRNFQQDASKTAPDHVFATDNDHTQEVHGSGANLVLARLHGQATNESLVGDGILDPLS
jgi:hypothetical protein